MIKSYVKLLRVPQWIKNFFVFVPLIFSKHIFDINYVGTALLGFMAFCFTSSIVYIINDMMDVEADRMHPVKKNRPIASGKISVLNAGVTAVVLLALTIGWFIYFGVNQYFIFCIISYFIINFLYSVKLKHMVLLDIFSIAAGFMLRVLSGGLIINVYISSWLILTTMFISLFLAIMKRYSELDVVSETDTKSTRKVLEQYSKSFTQQMAVIAAAATIICYALYTVSERTIKAFNTENLIYTTPFVVFGIFRYMYLVYMDKKGENTTEVMMTDIPMITNVVLYFAIITLILYNKI
ncbi:MAG: decaprenyl-phosphate phosphoribosyltransferase [Bacteroidota bacterium]|nr:decaprenyl-phosphate phosphoribosyltransferase [Bacteroidota bacterium]